MAGMTVAAGSPAFRDLVANEDAFTVSCIKNAGGVILGRTNMPPMAAGGMQRGVYGRAESPYNAEYLTAAFASGSSNGSATATAASIGVFGMGEETISSGRSPASNNGLVAYTPSRGVISLRGNWSLFPTCDVVVPHARTVGDMFCLLDVIVRKDENVEGDFWRGQPFVKLPEVEDVRPKEYTELADAEALSGTRIGVPKMYIGGQDSDPRSRKVETRESILELWRNARKKIEALGATVVEVDFPVVTNFDAADELAEALDREFTPPHHNEVDMAHLMAFAWDDFLVANGDANVATSLAQIESSTIFPHPPGTLSDRYDRQDPLVRHKEVVAHITKDRGSIYDIPGLGDALRNLETRRKTDYEDWMTELNLDAVVWPCNADVGRSDADMKEESARHAWKNGVLYSNGNCAIRQLGIPTVSVTMGVMADTKMPVNLTFAGKAYDDSALLKYAFAFEEATKARRSPERTPELATDLIAGQPAKTMLGTSAPELALTKVGKMCDGKKKISLGGTVSAEEAVSLEVYVDGVKVEKVAISSGEWNVDLETEAAFDRSQVRPEEARVPDLGMSMVIAVAKDSHGRSTARMAFV